MLRRCFTTPLAAVATSTSTSTAASLLAAQRNVVLTQQNEVLKNNAAHLKYKSPIWVEERDDKWWFDRLSKLKEGERPTEVRAEHVVDFFPVADGFRDGRDAERDAGRADGPSSFVTKKPFADSVARVLRDACRQHNWKSFYWIQRHQIRKHLDLPLLAGVRPVRVRMAKNVKVYNANQFEEPDKISQFPLSASNLSPFGRQWSDALREQKTKYDTGLWFSPKLLQVYGLEVADGEEPLKLEASERQGGNQRQQQRNSAEWYNAEQLADSEGVMKELMRFPVDAPTFLVSGNKVNERLAAKLPASSYAKSNYWFTGREASMKSWKIKEGEKPALGAGEGNSSNDFNFYNVAQLKDQEKAFSMAGRQNADSDHKKE